MAFILRGGNQIRPLKKEQTEEIISPWGGSHFIGQILFVGGWRSLIFSLALLSDANIYSAKRTSLSLAFPPPWNRHIPQPVLPSRGPMKWPTVETRRNETVGRAAMIFQRTPPTNRQDLCSYLPRTRMRVLDRSTILSGQLAILA